MRGGRRSRSSIMPAVPRQFEKGCISSLPLTGKRLLRLGGICKCLIVWMMIMLMIHCVIVCVMKVSDMHGKWTHEVGDG